MTLIDTHCHLTDKKFGGNIEGILERARSVGVEKVIVPSANLKDLKNAIKITKKHEGVFCLAGIFPGQARKSEDWKGDLVKMEKLIEKEKKVVGIGEVGLDCYWDKRDMDLEKEVFKAQLELALKLKLPVAIHNRLAEAEITDVFESIDELPRGQFHCWSGDSGFLRYVLGKGFYVSFCGNITYKSNDLLKKLLKEVPLDRLLLETDSPYLSPEPLRGTLNEPKNVKITATFMASALGISLSNLINQTSKNSLCLFRLGS